MKPQEYLRQLQIEIDMGDDYDEIQAAKHRLEGAQAMYTIMSWGWKKLQNDEEYKAKKRAYQKEYYQKNKEYFKSYQREYLKRKKEAEHEE